MLKVSVSPFCPPSSPTNRDIIVGPSELKLQISISTDKSVAELKQAIAEKSDVPADRQRLIYSGVSHPPIAPSMILKNVRYKGRVLKVFLRIVVATGAGAYLTDCSLRT